MPASRRRHTSARLPWQAPAVPEPVISVPAWTDRALCAQTDPEAFFPEKGASSRQAKKVCMACPVRTECLEYALLNDERFGIWGGKSEQERRRIKRERAVAAPMEVAS